MSIVHSPLRAAKGIATAATLALGVCLIFSAHAGNPTAETRNLCEIALKSLEDAFKGFDGLRSPVSGSPSDSENWQVDESIEHYVRSFLKTQDPALRLLIKKAFADLVTIAVNQKMSPSLKNVTVVEVKATTESGENGFLLKYESKPTAAVLRRGNGAYELFLSLSTEPVEAQATPDFILQESEKDPVAYWKQKS